MSATRVLRERVGYLSDSLDRAARPGINCSAAVVGVTTTIKTYPTVANSYFGITPQRITGTNAEGDTGTFASDITETTKMVALNIGTQLPPEGTQVVCHGVGGRWAFRYDG